MSSTLSTIIAIPPTQSSVVALTTTFIPPATCTEQRLTQLASPGYQIWLNEPVPVSGSTLTECYPTEFINAYTSTRSSSIAPLLSPLVCPQNYATVFEGPSSYIACCPSGFHLAYPTTTADPSRPAYGGTCYSNFEVGRTTSVTAYDSLSVTATAPWAASTSVDQAYAHPIDGIAAQAAFTSQNSTTNATTTATNSTSTSTIDATAITLTTDAPSTTPTTPAPSHQNSSGLSGGAIAGIVVGSVLGALLLLSAIVFALWRRKRRQRQQVQQQRGYDQYGGGGVEKEQQPKAELGGPGMGNRHEIGSSGVGPVELDGGGPARLEPGAGEGKEGDRVGVAP